MQRSTVRVLQPWGVQRVGAKLPGLRLLLEPALSLGRVQLIS